MSADYGDLISDSDSDACEISSESEPADRYYDGTYYPICIGDVLHTRYRIIHKLGWGGFSTVWLARDEQTNEDVALKVLVAGSDGEKEYEVQKWVKESIEEGKREGLVLYKDAFQVQGMREEHRVLVMDVVGPNLDMTLLRMLLESHIKVRMKAARQLLVTLKVLHGCGIVHGDLNEGAVMWKMQYPSPSNTTAIYQHLGRPQRLQLWDLWKKGEHVRPLDVPSHLLTDQIFLGDFGEAIKDGAEVECKIKSPAQFCAPERYHGQNPSCASDMWGYMCILGLLYLDFNPLFGRAGSGMIREWTAALGPFPEGWKGRYEGFDEDWEDGWYDQTRRSDPMIDLKSDIARRSVQIDGAEQALVKSVFLKVFRYESKDRLTASELLEDPEFNVLMGIYGC